MEVFGDEQQLCPCYKECQEFQKLVELKDSGLVVYCHRPRTEDIRQAEAVESAVNTSNDVFILYNKKNVKITSSELTSELEKENISCPRCRKTYEHAQKLLQEVKSIERQIVMGICDHCKKAQWSKNPFCACDKIVKKFISVKVEQKEDPKKYFETVPLKIEHLRRDKMVNKENQKAYSDFQINRGLSSRASRNEPEVEQMFSHAHFKSDIISLSETNLKQGCVNQAVAFIQPVESVKTSAPTPHESENINTIIQGNSVVDLEREFVFPRPSLKHRVEKEIFEDIPSMDAKEALKRRHDFSLRQMMRQKDLRVPYSVSKMPDIYETPKIAPWAQKEPTSKDHVESKLDIKIPTLKRGRRGPRGLDDVLKVKFRSTRSSQAIYIEPKKVDSYHHYKIQQDFYDSEEEPKKAKKLEDQKKPEQHVTELKSVPIETVGNIFEHIDSFFFPKVMKEEEKKVKLDVSSSHLIKDTREKFRLQSEREKKRQEEERQKKLEQAQKKNLAYEEKRLQAEEEKRQAIEDQNKYEKEQRKVKIEQKKLEKETRKYEEEQNKLAELKKYSDKDLESKPVVKIKKQDKSRRDTPEEKDDKIISKSKVKGKISKVSMVARQSVIPKLDHRDKISGVSEKNKIAVKVKPGKKGVHEVIEKISKDLNSGTEQNDKMNKVSKNAETDLNAEAKQKDKVAKEEQKITPGKEDLEKQRRDKADNLKLEKLLEKIQKERATLKAQAAKDKEMDDPSKKEKVSKEMDDPSKKEKVSKEMDDPSKKEKIFKERDELSKKGKASKEMDDPSKKEKASKERDELSKKGKASKEMDDPSKKEKISKAMDDPSKKEKISKAMDDPSKKEKVSKERDELSKKGKASKEMDDPSKKEKISKAMDDPSKKGKASKEMDELSKKGKASKEMDELSKKGKASKEMDEHSTKENAPKRTLDASGGIKVSITNIQKTIQKETPGVQDTLKIVHWEALESKPIKKEAVTALIQTSALQKLQAEHLKEKEEALRKKKQLEYEEQVAKEKEEAEATAKQDELETQSRKRASTMGPTDIHPEVLAIHKCNHPHTGLSRCHLCFNSELKLEVLNLESKKKRRTDETHIIIGEKIFKYKPGLEKIQEPQGIPILFQKKFYGEPDQQLKPIEQLIPQETKPDQKEIRSTKFDVEPGKGVIRYALSDRTFIDKGWTMLPTEKVVRKMNVYRMRPAHPEFDWFEHNKNKGLMSYDSGEKLAEFDDNGRGRWYYRNGRLALDYYDAEETNAQQRFVIYSSGEPDERGRTHPITILATFDYLGNGIVFDHAGKIRLKYNQTEGVVLDRGIGPISHWQWHSLNDPPVLQKVMIDTQMALKDPDILKLGPGGKATKTARQTTRQDNEEMLAIEFDNFIKEKSKKLFQKFQPFQIRMKALKINEHFSLKVLDQATVYLIFRDGLTNLKLNIGMILDHQEIVDTDTAEVGEVSNSLQKFPARTDSLAGLQRSVAHAQRYERQYVERDRRLRPPMTCASADHLTAAVSPPLRLPLRTVPTVSSCTGYSNRKSTNNLYYDTRLCC